jgi:hypothetical protein
MAALLGLLAVAFVAFVGHLNRMLYGAPPDGVATGETGRWALVPLAACALALVWLGLVLPTPIETLLDRIVEITAR